MSRLVLLDETPLNKLSHSDNPDGIREWLAALLESGTDVLVPEIADYEVRRGYHFQRGKGGQLNSWYEDRLRRLDQLKKSLGYIPLDTPTMLLAAEFYAKCRHMGHATGKDEALDGDMILSAQAHMLRLAGDDVVVATANVRHFVHIVPAELWSRIK